MTPPKGLNTIIGYATALILGLAAAATTILNSIDQTSVPPWVIALLVALAALGERITGLSRVSQVNATTKASAVLPPSIPPALTAQAGPMDPGDLDAVDAPDAELLPAQEG